MRQQLELEAVLPIGACRSRYLEAPDPEWIERRRIAALEYAALGIRVIPLERGSKRPLFKGWKVHATQDPAKLERWFQKNPRSNVGVLTGGGIFVLDIDPKNDGPASYELLRHGDLPITAHARTGSGGDHFMFRADGKVRGRIGLLPGIDIKGDGGYIVAAPSIHPTTYREYEWLRHPKQGVAEAPAWLLELISAEKPKPKRPRPTKLHPTKSEPPELPDPPAVRLVLDQEGDPETLLAELIERFPVTGKGQRNDTMVKVIGSLLGRGYVESLTAEVTRRWWVHFYEQGLISTSPEEAEREIKSCIRCTITSKTFRKAVGIDHREACKSIVLNEERRTRVRDAIVDTNIIIINITTKRTSEQ